MAKTALQCSQLFLVAAVAFLAVPAAEGKKCLEDACPTSYDKDKIYIHIVPHTHDDVGWLVTVDQYFWTEVQYIIDGIVKELIIDPKKTFSYVEQAYFWRWWLIQSDDMKEAVKKIVNNGQLEFVEGGWCSNDEAATHYVGIIEQMGFGLERLNETFGECGRPLVAFQFDPFGHSKEQASLYAQMGFQAVFPGRIHYNDWKKRTNNQEMEFIWNASDDLGEKGNIFTSIVYDGYGAPDGFGDDAAPDIDTPELFGAGAEYNIDSAVDKFLANVKENAKAYRTNHVLINMGDDFTYQNANHYFKNIDIIIRNVNKRGENGSSPYVAKYSSGTCYAKAALDALQAASNVPAKQDDFFPYASDEHNYWTGYFTSRPTFKGFVRDKMNLLQVCKQQGALHSMEHGRVTLLGEGLSLAQHHDAVSGTAKQAVTQDYALRISRGLSEAEKLLDGVLQKSRDFHADSAKNVFCLLVNNSVCDVTNASKHFDVTVFNGDSKPRQNFLRIPVPAENYQVSFDGAVQNSTVQKIVRSGQLTSLAYELVFLANVPPLGFVTYNVAATAAKPAKNAISSKPNKRPAGTDDVTIQNNLIKLTFSGATGLLTTIEDLVRGTKTPISQNFLYYTPATQGQSSGAYIFATADSQTQVQRQIIAKDPVKIYIITTDLYSEVTQIFAGWVSQVVRLYKDKPYAEFEWTVGPIPVDEQSHIGKEVYSLFTSGIKSNGTFYTDANGRQIIQRVRNFQPTYSYDGTEAVAGNYYPVNTRIFINDSNTQLTVLTDRSEGGSSLEDGTVELMVHRRLLQDDGKGVGQNLNETMTGFYGVGPGLVARGRHWLIVGSPKPAEAALLHRHLAQELFYSPVLTFAATDGKKAKSKVVYQGLAQPLPAEVNIVTLQQAYEQPDQIMIRFEHSFQAYETSSTEVSFVVNKLFTGITISECQQLTLAGNRPITSVSPWLRKPRDQTSGRPQSTSFKSAVTRSANGDIKISLTPFEIATVICAFEKQSV